MRRFNFRLSQAVAAALLLGTLATGLLAAERHLALVKSDPANSSTLVQAPKAITLWFSQTPNLKLTRIVLTHGADTIKTGAVMAADTSGKTVRATIDTMLASGKYQIMWRTLSRDGHAVAGKIAFAIDTVTKPSVSQKR
ncbi:MAG: copper resistance CopC family protein [Gemmatimonadota bacterium]